MTAGSSSSPVFAIDAPGTPVGMIKGALKDMRPDHLTAHVIQAIVERNSWLDPASIDDVYWGAANQAGEDNRNAARLGVLLAGLPVTVPDATVNRLRGSGLEGTPPGGGDTSPGAGAGSRPPGPA